jgi:hypothetical protein
LDGRGEAEKEIVLDLDSTDIALHGEQEERFFHGYYGHYCYRSLYIVCGEYVCAPGDCGRVTGNSEVIPSSMIARSLASCRQIRPEPGL